MTLFPFSTTASAGCSQKERFEKDHFTRFSDAPTCLISAGEKGIRQGLKKQNARESEPRRFLKCFNCLVSTVVLVLNKEADV